MAYDTVTFYKRDVYGRGVESGQPFMGWHSWTDGRWLLELHARSDRFMPVSDWLASMEAESAPTSQPGAMTP